MIIRVLGAEWLKYVAKCCNVAWAKSSSYLKAVLTGPTLPFAFQERARYMTAVCRIQDFLLKVAELHVLVIDLYPT